MFLLLSMDTQLNRNKFLIDSTNNKIKKRMKKLQKLYALLLK
jgi:hypothetical protein